MAYKLKIAFLLGLALIAITAAVALQSARQNSNHSVPSGPMQTQGAVSTGGAHAAVLDSEKRPITAGGFVENGHIVFQNIAEKAGLTSWRHVMGTEEGPFHS